MMEAIAPAIVCTAIVATMFCFRDFVKYIRDRYFRGITTGTAKRRRRSLSLTLTSVMRN